MKTITTLHYNFFQSSDSNESEEAYYEVNVGEKHCRSESPVKEIIEHPAKGEGDKWYYDIVHQDDNVIRIFNPNMVFFKKDQSVF